MDATWTPTPTHPSDGNMDEADGFSAALCEGVFMMVAAVVALGGALVAGTVFILVPRYSVINSGSLSCCIRSTQRASRATR